MSFDFWSYHLTKFRPLVTQVVYFIILQKPLDLLATGVLALFLSCLILLGLLCFLCKEVNADIASIHRWHLEETLTFGVILILILSMGSSSMVEEEQYIWHFVTSTMYVALVRRTVQSLPTRGNQVSPSGVKGRKSRLYYQICSVTALLISGRLLRNWHQGGVNWTHLPDISKWLEHEGSCLVKWFQLSSVIVITILSMIVLMSLRLVKYFVLMINLISLLLGGLVLQHTVKNQESSLTASTYGSTSIAQIIYATLGISTIGTAIVVPWIIPISIDFQDKYLFVPLRDSAHVIGWRYIFSWSLLQQILQQPVNSMPILLLVLQILACMSYFSTTSPHYKKWVEVSSVLVIPCFTFSSSSSSLVFLSLSFSFVFLSDFIWKAALHHMQRSWLYQIQNVLNSSPPVLFPSISLANIFRRFRYIEQLVPAPLGIFLINGRWHVHTSSRFKEELSRVN